MHLQKKVADHEEKANAAADDRVEEDLVAVASAASAADVAGVNQPQSPYLFLRKKSCMSAAHSASRTPRSTCVLGCSAFGAKRQKPRFSSAAP